MYTRSDMPDLMHRLGTQDLGFLEIVAECMGCDAERAGRPARVTPVDTRHASTRRWWLKSLNLSHQMPAWRWIPWR
jgi:hypothetical protein